MRKRTRKLRPHRRRKLKAQADRPTLDDMCKRLEKRRSTRLRLSIVKAVRDERDGR